jgi:putative ABC transport system substrate-binding protein
MSQTLKTVGIVLLSAVVIFLAYLFINTTEIVPTQNSMEPKTIGILYFRQHLDTFNGMKTGMADLGYTEENLNYNEILLTPGPNLYQDIDNGVKKLIDEGVDLIWVSMEHQGLEAIKITEELGRTDVPIVFMARFHDPVAFGLAESYRSSGNNSTGVATNMPQNTQKTLQFFKEINPQATKIGVFSDGFMVPPNFGDAYLEELKKQAPKFDMTVVEYKTTKEPDITIGNWQEVADTIQTGDIDAIFHIAVHFYDPQETAETELAQRLGIPLSVPSEDLPTGGMFSYSDDFAQSAKQAAIMIDKIFRGTNPSDIPVEFGSKQTLSLHLTRAEGAGFAFPNSMLFIAEEQITQ